MTQINNETRNSQMRMGSKKSVFVCYASENTTLYNSKVTNSTHPHKENKKRNQLSLVTARKDSENTTKSTRKSVKIKGGGRERKGTAYTETKQNPYLWKWSQVFCLFILLLCQREVVNERNKGDPCGFH